MSIDSSFKEIFEKLQHMIAFRKNTKLKQLIETNIIRNNQKFLIPAQTTTTDQCTLLHQSITLKPTSSQNKSIYKHSNQRDFFRQVTCHSNYVIYLLECVMCKIQYFGKSETSFNIKLNNHRKDVWKPNAIEACINTLITMNIHTVNMANL